MYFILSSTISHRYILYDNLCFQYACMLIIVLNLCSYLCGCNRYSVCVCVCVMGWGSKVNKSERGEGGIPSEQVSSQEMPIKMR